MIKFIFTLLEGKIRGDWDWSKESRYFRDDCLHWGNSRGWQKVAYIVVDVGERLGMD